MSTVVGEDLGVFVHAAALKQRGGMIEQAPVVAQPLGEEKNLRVERPRAHVAIEVREVRVLVHGLVKRRAAELVGKQSDEARLPCADVSRDRDEVFTHRALPSSSYAERISSFRRNFHLRSQ